MTRVLVDATALPENRGGVGRYVDELVAALIGLGVDVQVASQPRDAAGFSAVVGADAVHASPTWSGSAPARLCWEQSLLPVLTRRLRPRALHSPHYTMPVLRVGGVRRVVTFHDATFFSDPGLHLPVKARFFRAWTRVSGRLADAVIAPSEATRTEVARHTGIDPARIHVVPHGVDNDHFRPPTTDAVHEVRQWLDLGDAAYVAFLGTLEPRKNVPALIRAWVRACQGRPDPPVLVLAGGRGWDDEVDLALAEVPRHLTVVRPGFVPDALVPALLGGARVVAYPAFGEGFGLPVLEAMACGACVLTTRRLSLPEVGGDAVAYAASPSVPDLVANLDALLDDPERRAELAAAAVKRAQTFTWRRAAESHLAVYEGVEER